MSTSISNPGTFTLVPSSFEDAMKISSMLAKSELVPKDFRQKPENVLVAIAWGQELGLAPLAALQNIAVINGRPAIWGDAALAVVMSHPDFEWIKEFEETGVAKCIIKRKGLEPVERTFSVADSTKAGLAGKQGPWAQYPARMRQMRARGFAIRDSFPDALKGFKTAEEVQDIEEKDVTPPPKPAVTMPRSKTKKLEAPEQEAIEEATPTQEAAQTEEQASTVEVDPETGEVIPPNVGVVVEAKAVHRQTEEAQVTLSESQLRVIRSQLQSAGIDESKAAHQFDCEKIEQIPASACNGLLQWIKANRVQS